MPKNTPVNPDDSSQASRPSESQETVQFTPSLMESSDIAATINTRELTGEDAQQWAKVVAKSSVENVTGVGESTEATVNIPAIERTVSERNFDRLRVCDITPLKSEPKVSSDYRLIRKLGQGGMGDVFVARQGSLDRLLALKRIKPLEGQRRQKLMQTGRLEEVEQERKLQFLSEAMVTSDLDHPNIVPIHDVAVTDQGDLFYSMKRVVGTPWSDKIGSLSLPDNIEVLLDVCDAIALAHTRGVVHRDIKPENIMLGEFGVVMVMDWGLALPTPGYADKRPSAILTTTGLGGTPAFMAPEMATGPVDRIGPAADVYLLGATLFMIITGKAPHHASTVTECLQAVRENRIRTIAPQHESELIRIAYRAMETNPADRYPEVPAFQQAIRDYLQHASSIEQCREASQLLSAAIKEESYEQFSKARYQYEAALSSWSENKPAQEGFDQTLIQHAETALAKEDFDLGLSLLDEGRTDHQRLIGLLLEGKHQRSSRESRLQWLKKLAAAMLLFIFMGVGIATYAINQERQHALSEKAIADQQRTLANEQRHIAEEKTVLAKASEVEALKQKTEAETQRGIAVNLAKTEAAAKDEAQRQTLKAQHSETVAKQARADAVQKRNQAIAATQRANYEQYVSKMGLAKASLERNEAGVARRILREMKEQSPHADGWEWRWLWRQAGGAESETSLSRAVIDLSLFPGKRQGVLLMDNGEIQKLTIDSDQASAKNLQSLPVEVSPLYPPIGRVGLSGPGRAYDQSRDEGALPGRYRVRPSRREGDVDRTCVAVSPDASWIAVGYHDGAILVHHEGKAEQIGSHDAAVHDLQFADNRFFVSASADRTVRVWEVDSKQEPPQRLVCWHGASVDRIAVVPQASGLLIAAATSHANSGQVALWRVPFSGGASGNSRPEKRGVFEGHRRPISAITLRQDGRLGASGDVDGNVLLWNPALFKATDYEEAIKKALKESGASSTKTKTKEASMPSVPLVDHALQRAHRDTVQGLVFSPSGDALISASNDHTLKQWDVSSRHLIKKMRGHGGPITGVAFIGTDSDQIVSVSQDQTVRTWQPSSSFGEAVVATKAHSFEISSARFSPDGSRVVTAGRDHTARLMKIDPDRLTFVDEVRLDSELLNEGTDHVALSMTTDAKEKQLFIGSADSTVRIWDVRTGVQQGEVTGTGISDAMAVSNDGTLLLTGSSSPQWKAILWRIDPTGKTKPQRRHGFKGHDQAVTALAISPDRQRLFTGDGIGYGILWDAQTGQPVGPPIENARGFRIGAATFANDSRSLWIGADDGQLTQVDLASRKNLKRLNHDGFVTEISIHHDGRHGATRSEWITETQLVSLATLWDLATEESIALDRRVEAMASAEGKGKGKRITSASFGHSGDTLVVGSVSSDGPSTLKVWKTPAAVLASKAKQADLVFALPSRIGSATSAFPMAGGRCLTLNRNGAFAWKFDQGKLDRSYRSHAALTEAAFSPDGKWIATASRSVKLWDSQSGKAIMKLEAPHAGPVRSIDFQPMPVNEKAKKPAGNPVYEFATGGDDSLLRMWSWEPGKQPVESGRIRIKPASRIKVVRYSEDGTRLLVACDGGVARVMDLENLGSVWELDLPETDIDFICGNFDRDGVHVALGSHDGLARVWKLDDRPSKSFSPMVLRGHADAIESIQMLGDADHGYRVFTASADDSVKIWDPYAGKTSGKTSGENPEEKSKKRQGRELLSLQKHRGDLAAIDLSPDGRLMMTAGKDGQVILWPAGPMEEDMTENLFDALE